MFFLNEELKASVSQGTLATIARCIAAVCIVQTDTLTGMVVILAYMLVQIIKEG